MTSHRTVCNGSLPSAAVGGPNNQTCMDHGRTCTYYTALHTRLNLHFLRLSCCSIYCQLGGLLGPSQGQLHPKTSY